MAIGPQNMLPASGTMASTAAAKGQISHIQTAQGAHGRGVGHLD